jgi:hypothetical protein
MTGPSGIIPPHEPRSRRTRSAASVYVALFFVAISVSSLAAAVVPVAFTFALLAEGYSATAVGGVLTAKAIPAIILMLAAAWLATAGHDASS